MNLTRRKIIKCFGAALAGVTYSPVLANISSNNLTTHTNRINTPRIINSGIGGNNTNEMLARLDRDCLTYKPRLTILMAGTNDMNSVKYVPLDLYERNMDAMATQITGSGSVLILMTILPSFEPYLFTRHPKEFYQPEGVPERRRQVNEVIKRIAIKHDAHLLDIEKRFSAVGKIGLDKDSLISNEANSNKTDGIHPTANGYRFIGLALFDYITDHKLPVDTIVCFGDSITKGDGSTTKDSYPGNLFQLLTASTD